MELYKVTGRKYQVEMRTEEYEVQSTKYQVEMRATCRGGQASYLPSAGRFLASRLLFLPNVE